MATSIAVASGKGGVGKTSMSVNLSLIFAQMEKRTTLLDADFGMDDDDIEDDEEARAQAFADMEDEFGDEEEWDESIKVINGKKYRAIKESVEPKNIL